MTEEALLLREWNQCLSLIWFDEGVKPFPERWDEDEDNRAFCKTVESWGIIEDKGLT